MLAVLSDLDWWIARVLRLGKDMQPTIFQNENIKHRDAEPLKPGPSQDGWSSENKTNVLIHGITDGIYRQDWCLPIILITSINTVIKKCL